MRNWTQGWEAGDDEFTPPRDSRVLRAHPFLSPLPLAAGAALLPLSSHLFGLCPGSHPDPWPVPQPAARHPPPAPLSSHHLAGWRIGLRSCSPFQTPAAMNNNKNLILAFALSAAVLFAWQWFVAMPQMKADQAHQAALAHQEKPKTAGGAPGSPNLALPQGGSGHMSREAALKAGGARIVIDTPMLDGSIALTGAKLDDL